MLRLFLRTVLTAVSISVLLIGYVVGVRFGLWQPMNRPSSVPGGAHYVPTMKAETWFECSVDRSRNVNHCRAWDGGGNLIAFGSYRLDGENRAATEKELQPSQVLHYYDHPNLAWIYLFKDGHTFGRTLVPVDENGRPLERFDVR